MPSPKKLLILSCSIGSGHVRAAEALRLACTKLHPDIDVLHLDMAPYLGWLTRTSVVASYRLISTSIPIIYKALYHITDFWMVQKIVKFFSFAMTFGGRKIISQINKWRPDYIISTHYLAQILLPNNFSTPIDTVITDYYPHKTWLSPKVRYTFVATEEMKNDLAKFGITTIVSGIPIDPEFLKEKNINELKSKLGIKNAWPIILIMPTAGEKIKLEEVVQNIYLKYANEQINIIVIDSAHVKISPRKNLMFLGKIENIDEWMRIADVIITKAGGLTTTEALHLQKPMIIINSIPGQEDHNADYLEKNQLAVSAHSAEDAADKIAGILTNKIFLNKKPYPDAGKIILEKTLATN